jgi:hypothetical protein
LERTLVLNADLASCAVIPGFALNRKLAKEGVEGVIEMVFGRDWEYTAKLQLCEITTPERYDHFPLLRA